MSTHGTYRMYGHLCILLCPWRVCTTGNKWWKEKDQTRRNRDLKQAPDETTWRQIFEYQFIFPIYFSATWNCSVYYSKTMYHMFLRRLWEVHYMVAWATSDKRWEEALLGVTWLQLAGHAARLYGRSLFMYQPQPVERQGCDSCTSFTPCCLKTFKQTCLRSTWWNIIFIRVWSRKTKFDCASLWLWHIRQQETENSTPRRFLLGAQTMHSSKAILIWRSCYIGSLLGASWCLN